jgi:D-arabinose 1-dehydrogenase-like Zn-dependent alcohol dehydrogenase
MAGMLAARLDFRSHRLAVTEVDIPVPKGDEVLIRVAAAGVCLTDVHLIGGHIQRPGSKVSEVTLGHEVAGTIHELGEGVPECVKVGDRVVVHAGRPCRVCANCRFHRPCSKVQILGVDYDGGWAQYVVADVSTVLPIPDSLSFEQAAILPDAVSTPWAAITVSAKVTAGEAVGVWGIGGLGTHAVQLLRLIGASPIVAFDPLPAARERALACGATAAIDPLGKTVEKEVLAVTQGSRLDVALDMVGGPAICQQALAFLGRRGRLVLVGAAPGSLTVADGLSFMMKNQQIVGHLGSEAVHLGKLIDFTRLGLLDLSKSISGAYPLADAVEAVRRLQSKDVSTVRLVLRP